MQPPVYTEEWLTGPTSTNFYIRIYDAQVPRAVLIFAHGAAEHAGRHAVSHAALAARGITVLAYDQRGFGRTALDTEHRSKDSAYGKTNWDMQLRDVEWLVGVARGRWAELQVFLGGFSMGAVVMLSFVTREEPPPAKDVVTEVAGVIGSAPTFLLTKPPPRLVLWLGSQIRRIAPYTVFPVRNKTTDLSRNAETNSAYLEDPLVKTPGSLQGIADALKGGEELLHKAYRNWPSGLPVLILQGTADQVSAPDATEDFFQELPAVHKKLVIFPDACHELHNEPDGVKEKYVEECVAFVESCVARLDTH